MIPARERAEAMKATPEGHLSLSMPRWESLADLVGFKEKKTADPQIELATATGAAAAVASTGGAPVSMPTSRDRDEDCHQEEEINLHRLQARKRHVSPPDPPLEAQTVVQGCLSYPSLAIFEDTTGKTPADAPFFRLSYLALDILGASPTKNPVNPGHVL